MLSRAIGCFRASVVELTDAAAVESFRVDSGWGFGENGEYSCGLPDHWPSVPAGKEGSTVHGCYLRCQAPPL